MTPPDGRHGVLLLFCRDTPGIVLARAVRWHTENRIAAFGNRTVVFS